jgi:uncharacterized protein
MNYPDTNTILLQTKKWITNVVIGCKFCPFAAKEVLNETIQYKVIVDAGETTVLQTALGMMQDLDNNTGIETSFLILPGKNFTFFDQYLKLVELVNNLLAKKKYEGIYQVASFHPAYLFDGSTGDDPSNYTNRSPYPMLHFLREASISKVIDSYPGVNDIPARNIAFTKEKGLLYMQQLFQKSF